MSTDIRSNSSLRFTMKDPWMEALSTAASTGFAPGRILDHGQERHAPGAQGLSPDELLSRRGTPVTARSGHARALDSSCGAIHRASPG